MNAKNRWDVVIVGGSYAGLSAAMALGRSLKKVMVVDGGKPCNAATPHSHNFLTQDGRTPSEISQNARHQVSLYHTVEMYNDFVTKAERAMDGFAIDLQSGKQVFSRKLIFATGIKDSLLDIPGFNDCWGISVIHCPYCHGYEYRGKETAILANGEPAMHYAMLLSNLTPKLSILTNGKADFTHEQLGKLHNHNIVIDESKLFEIKHDKGYLKEVVTENAVLKFDALYFRPPFQQHSIIPEQLGCEFNELGYIKVDATQKTTLDGVYACGDNSSTMRSVANAVATGNLAGASVNRELAIADF